MSGYSHQKCYLVDKHDICTKCYLFVVVGDVWWHHKWIRIFNMSSVSPDHFTFEASNIMPKNIFCHMYVTFVQWTIFISPLLIVLMNTVVLG